MAKKITYTTTEATIRPVVEALEALFAAANTKWYDGKLDRPVITVSPDTTKGAYGWCTGYRAWTADASDKADRKTEGYYEINVCAEHLQRPVAEVVGTLLHEMVHLYDEQRGVKDTSRNGWYHNETYRKEAEAHGLVCSKTDKYGWSETKLSEDAQAWLTEQGLQDFLLHRRAIPKKERKTAKNHSIKYTCPCCGNSVRATKSLSVVCGDCHVQMALDI